MKTPHYSAADIEPLAAKYRRAQWLVIGCLATLCALISYVNLTEANGSWARWSLQILPLALFIPACLRGHHRSFSWLCFVSLFYFTALVVAAMTPGGYWPDYWGVAASIVLFCASMMASRWRQHSQLAKWQNASDPQPHDKGHAT